jgi:hypothetical protein
MEEGKIVPKKPGPHTAAAINRADMYPQRSSDATWASSGRP